MKRSRVRAGAALVALGAIPGLVPRAIPGHDAANAPAPELVGGLVMLTGTAVLAVAWAQDATSTDAEPAARSE